MPFEYLALFWLAVCWAVGSLLSATASSHLGAFAFTRWRLACAASMLWLWAFASGGYQHFSHVSGTTVSHISAYWDLNRRYLVICFNE